MKEQEYQKSEKETVVPEKEMQGQQYTAYEKVQMMLEKQMDMLSKHQENAHDIKDIIAVSYAMAEIAKAIIFPLWLQEAEKASRQCWPKY